MKRSRYRVSVLAIISATLLQQSRVGQVFATPAESVEEWQDVVYVKTQASQRPPSHSVSQPSYWVWYVRPGPGEPGEENSSILHIIHPNSGSESQGENHPGMVVCSHTRTSYLLLHMDES